MQRTVPAFLTVIRILGCWPSISLENLPIKFGNNFGKIGPKDISRRPRGYFPKTGKRISFSSSRSLFVFPIKRGGRANVWPEAIDGWLTCANFVNSPLRARMNFSRHGFLEKIGQYSSLSAISGSHLRKTSLDFPENLHVAPFKLLPKVFEGGRREIESFKPARMAEERW